MRTSIVAWSAGGGALLGAFLGLLLFATGVVLAVVLPATAARVLERARALGAIVCFVVLPAIGAVLGYLEGRLKA